MFGTTPMHAPTTNDVGLCQVSKPSIWHRLGFRHRWDESLFDWRNQEPPEPGFVVGAFATHVVAHVSWLDRLRLFISGRCEIIVYTKTDVLVNKAASRSQFAVLPPFS